MHTNRLAQEKSPYLQQHAHNPVDWYPWGEEAFAKARAEDKPIFLSIGYSTCHWCHVMERESFESEEIAALLNRHFVPIKVDREERPDVDRIYMLFVQATTGGGWPMSVFLTPELKPFFGGTYFPPDERYGRPGFGSLLTRLAELWTRDRARIDAAGEDLYSQLHQFTQAASSGASHLDPGAAESAFNHFRRSFDVEFGGFGGAPKFPRPVVLAFLLRYGRRAGNPEAAAMVLKTLEAMARGGIHDHLGGGFHRYSVDERWFVPHFEKMLYDQAQLAVSYLEAFQITHNELFARVARSTLDYVFDRLTHPEGAFYSAEDADSAPDPAHPERKSEGAFYLWSSGEIEPLLAPPAAAEFCRYYGVRPQGNVDMDPHGEFQGRNILFEAHPEDPPASLAQSRRVLWEARQRRPRPHRDEKILTAWNGLMISGFARGAQMLGEPRYAEAARRAARFILGNLYDPASGALFRRHRDGDSAISGFLDDYAFFALALTDLYETDFDPAWIDCALRLMDRARELFEDRAAGGFFSTAAGAAHLILRLKDEDDGAEPSANSAAILALLRLAGLAGREDLRAAAERALAAFSPRLNTTPAALPLMLAAAFEAEIHPRQVVIAGDAGADGLLAAVRGRFVPGVLVLRVNGANREALSHWNPLAARMHPIQGTAAAYVCENFVCREPVTDPGKLIELLP